MWWQQPTLGSTFLFNINAVDRIDLFNPTGGNINETLTTQIPGEEIPTVYVTIVKIG
ncbi:hypothetical protein [Paraclostridium bifermentans]|uniref:hypothetical protein n=1 Tax=Paraclostridium bifermentans TaxID=1490 RepID=UPI0018FEC1C2|nr:hypothetical protein [Paraclostridium bifermentans]